MRIWLVLCLIMVFVVSIAACSSADSWPMFRQNQERTGLGDTFAGGARPTPTWVFPVRGQTIPPIDDSTTSVYGTAPFPYFTTTGSWFTVNDDALVTGDPAELAENAEFQYAVTATAESATAVWTFENSYAAASKFYVYVWFPSDVVESNMPATQDARYTVAVQSYNSGTSSWDTVSTRSFAVDQTTGNAWVILGGASFEVNAPVGIDPGGRIVVTLSNLSLDEENVGSTVVIADAVVIVQDTGAVLSSPVVTNDVTDPLVLTAVFETRPLETVFGQDEYRYVGVVYGLHAEDDLGTAGVDERGTQDWSFPASVDNWIGGGISSSPVVWEDSVGNEYAAVGAYDGQVYVINTADGSLVWQGPGYTVDAPTATTGIWNAGTHSGYQGADYVEAAADSTETATATWTQAVDTAGSYVIYVWMPPSNTAQTYISDAQYTVTVGSGSPVIYSLNQRNGGTWVRLASIEVANNGDTVEVEVSNVTSQDLLSENLYVSADAVRILPAQFGGFDFSSVVMHPDASAPPPIVSDGTMYIGSVTGRVYKLNMSSHDIVWTFPNPYPGAGESSTDPASQYYPAPNPIGAVYASPALDTDRTTLYVASSDGRVYAVDTTTGLKKWVFPAEAIPTEPLGQISSTLTVDATHVFVAVGGAGDSTPSGALIGRVIALNKTDGTVDWMYPSDPDASGVGAFTYASPLKMQRAIDGGPSIFVGSTDGYFYGITIATGEGYTDGASPKWSTYPDAGDSIYSSAAGTIMTNYMDYDGNSLANASLAYAGTQGGRFNGFLLGSNGSLPITKEGKRDWWWDLFGAVTSSPALKDGRMYVGDLRGVTWGFSTVSGEGWNTDLGAGWPTSGSEAGPGGRTSEPEVALFTQSMYEQFLANADGNGAGKESFAIADFHSSAVTGVPDADSLVYEWGEDIYIVVASVLDPNNGLLIPGDPGFDPTTESTITLTFKSRAPEDEADSSETVTVKQSDKGWFYDTNDVLVFYAKYIYKLDASAGGKTQTPGTSISVSVMEKPADTNDASGDSVWPTAASVPAGRRDYVGRLLAVNNPLGLVYTDMDGFEPDTAVSVTTGPVWTTSRAALNAGVNGNFGIEPYVRPGAATHGKTAPKRDVTVVERSQLGLTGRSISRMRVQRSDLLWTGGPSHVVNALPWDVFPVDWGPNGSADYPNIGARQLGCSMWGSSLDPTSTPVRLMGASGAVQPIAPLGTWTVGRNGLSLRVSVPKYQPANLPFAWTSNDLRASGYTGRVYAFVDTNGNGRLDRPGILGLSQLLSSRLTGARAEAYREIIAQVHVNTDKRVSIAEQTIDVGDVPHGFGIQPDEFVPGMLQLFDNNLDPVGNPGYDAWFKNFTAYNIGNTNLTNLKVYPTFLVSDSVQSRSVGGNMVSGYIPAYGVVSNVDLRYVADLNFGRLGGYAYPMPGRTFRKARVTEANSILQLPDGPPEVVSGASQTYPSISVAVPEGMPAGTYHGQFTLFDDADNNGTFNPAAPGIEGVGNPVVNLTLTVTEARLTGGLAADSSRHLDDASTDPFGDMTPAPYFDGNRDLHLFWASSRLKNLGGDTPKTYDPWYLFETTLPWGAALPWGSLSWNFEDPTLAAPVWWQVPAAADAFPDPLNLDLRFPITGDLNVTTDPWDPAVGAPGRRVDDSEKFYDPSVAVDPDPLSTDAWLFFAGSVFKEGYVSTVPGIGNDRRTRESRVFYTKLTNGVPDPAPNLASVDWSMPKHGVRGLATRNAADDLWLWTFWYGGSNDKARIFYNVNTTPDNPANWSNEARLPILNGLNSMTEPSPVFRVGIGEPGSASELKNVMDVVYSGYSDFHKKSDIYLSRYLTGAAVKPEDKGGDLPVTMLKLGMVTDEYLQRDASRGIWYSKNVGWDVKDPNWKIWFYPNRDIATAYLVNSGSSSVDKATGVITYTYQDAAEADQYRLIRGAVVDPMSGTVKFLRLPGKNSLVTATYIPRAYRLTSDDAGDVSPFALLDGDDNTNYYSGNPLFWLPATWDSNDAPRMDRLWLFWRRPGLEKPGTGIHYKSFRWMVKLPAGIQIASNPSLIVSGQTWNVTEPVEVDWARNRLYFTNREEGNLVWINYVDSAGVTHENEPYVVELGEEMGSEGGTAFGNLTRVMVNEGQVSAVKDPVEDKLWVFWMSTRDGGSDIYYETISPRFFGTNF